VNVLTVRLASVAVKTVMAVTGLVLFAFVVFHLYNNVHIYFGQDAYNGQAFAWKTPAVVAKVRPTLLVSIVLHIIAGVTLAVMNRRARPVRYRVRRYKESTLAGRLMIVTGIVAGLFILYHILHAKVGSAHPDLYAMTDELGRRDLYNIIIVSFQQPLIALAYIVGLGCLFFHIGHGVTSTFSTLGLLNDKNRPVLRWVGPVVAVLLFIGYGSIPASVALGLLAPTP
jgi:succinate dehydrogenase / fumarate reductase cytochrome b subunit